MDAVEAYLAELRDIRASGGAVPETSGYGTLATLLNDVGHHLKPKVHCFINLANTGAGIPDGGLFVANQLQKGAEPLPGQVPQRGAIEVKPPNANAREVARGEQVAKYLEKYRQVLVTSYREFVLVGYDAEGRATPLESYSLASSETDFLDTRRAAPQGRCRPRRAPRRVPQTSDAAPGADCSSAGARLVSGQLRARGSRPGRRGW